MAKVAAPKAPSPAPPDVPETVRNAWIESTYNTRGRPSIPNPKDYGDNTPQYTPTMTTEEYVAKKKEEIQAIIEKYYCSGEADNIGDFDPKVFLGSHDVLHIGNHANVIIFADPNSQLVKDNPDLFENTITIDGVIWAYGTMGAGEKYLNAEGDLISENNRDGDVGVVQKNEKESPNSDMTEIEASYEEILALILSDKYFRENHNGEIAYGAIMKKSSEYYNSNSYAKGLLEAAGLSAPSLPRWFFDLIEEWFPGWDKPIPKSYFGK